MSLDDDARAELDELEQQHRLRVPRVVERRRGPKITIDGREVLDFASNDYLALAGDPRLVEAAAAEARESGAGAAASRLVTGNHRSHVVLEAALADWLRAGAVRLFGSGYAANIGVVSTLARAGDVVFSDELNHASLIDGCRLSRADVVVVPHRDLAALDEALRTRGGRRRFVVSESLFSMDGDLADVAELSALSRRHGAALILDEAHAIGARGPEGRGVAAAAGVVPDVLVGTCGKALGSFGAFVATTPAISALLWNRARSLVFSTALPPAVSAMTAAALQIVRSGEGDDRRARLASVARLLRQRLPRCGGAMDAAIAPVRVDDDQRVMQISGALLERGIFAQGIRPPTVPAGTARLRLSLGADHSAQHVEFAANELNDATRRST